MRKQNGIELYIKNGSSLATVGSSADFSFIRNLNIGTDSVLNRIYLLAAGWGPKNQGNVTLISMNGSSGAIDNQTLISNNTKGILVTGLQVDSVNGDVYVFQPVNLSTEAYALNATSGSLVNNINLPVNYATVPVGKNKGISFIIGTSVSSGSIYIFNATTGKLIKTAQTGSLEGTETMAYYPKTGVLYYVSYDQPEEIAVLNLSQIS